MPCPAGPACSSPSSGATGYLPATPRLPIPRLPIPRLRAGRPTRGTARPRALPTIQHGTADRNPVTASSAGWTAAPARRERLNPLTSLAAAAATAAITTAAGSWLLSLAVVAACLGLSVAAGTARRVLPAAAVVLVPLGLSLLWLHGLFFPEGRTVLAEWGPARITTEGLGFAGQRILLLAAVVLALLLFSFSVSVPNLVAALSARGVQGQF